MVQGRQAGAVCARAGTPGRIYPEMTHPVQRMRRTQAGGRQARETAAGIQGRRQAAASSNGRAGSEVRIPDHK